jgi:hypothetical protein
MVGDKPSTGESVSLNPLLCLTVQSSFMYDCLMVYPNLLPVPYQFSTSSYAYPCATSSLCGGCSNRWDAPLRLRGVLLKPA